MSESSPVEAPGRRPLEISRCRACGAKAFPMVNVCHQCLGEDLARLVSSGAGALYSFTRLHARGGPLRAVGYADLEDGVRVFGHLTRAERLDFGMAINAAMEPDPADPARMVCVLHPEAA